VSIPNASLLVKVKDLVKSMLASKSFGATNEVQMLAGPSCVHIFITNADVVAMSLSHLNNHPLSVLFPYTLILIFDM
jgi:hypothetical protein